MEHIDIPELGYETPCICVRRGWCSARLWSDLSCWAQGFVHPCQLTSLRHHVSAIHTSTLLFTEHIISPGMNMWLARKKILYNFKRSAVWHMTLCSRLKINACFEGTHSLLPQVREVSRAWNKAWCLLYACFCLVYSSTLKMEVIYSTEMSTGIHGSTRRFILDDTPLHRNSSKRLRSFIYLYYFPSDRTTTAATTTTTATI